MTTKRLFPASIVDELTYCVESVAGGLYLVYAWILTLEGEVKTDVCLEALDKALACYPKCRCILVNTYPSYGRWFHYRWEYTESTGRDIFREIAPAEPSLTIREAVDYYVRNHRSLSIDLSSHIPLKVLLIRQPQRTFLFFIMHHAVADGVGSLTFIQKFITCYEDIYYGREHPDPPSARFEDIALPEISFRWDYLSWHRLRPFLAHNALFRKEPPVRLCTGSVPGDSGRFVAGVRSVPSSRLKEISTICRQNQATINDYFLAAMFQTAKRWSCDWTAPSERIYITVPMNLRRPEDRSMSNVLSSVNVSLNPALISGTEELLQLIRTEMAMLRKNEIAQMTVNLSCLLKPIPIPLKKLLLKRTIPGFTPTILLSNLGVLSLNPSHTDEEGFHYLGPARICNVHVIPNAGTWPDVLVSTYNKQMAVTMAVWSLCFPPPEAERFLDAFIETIERI